VGKAVLSRAHAAIHAIICHRRVQSCNKQNYFFVSTYYQYRVRWYQLVVGRGLPTIYAMYVIAGLISAQKITLTHGHTAVTQDCVGGAHVEVKIG
jgi:hypothetical protein